MKIKQGSHTTTIPDSTPTMTHKQWTAEGKRRFGENIAKWRFVCPICGNVAAVEDYRQFEAQGATAESATEECIGRYTGSGRRAFGAAEDNVRPCDYAVYGLFRIPGVVVEMAGGQKRMAFAFGE